MTAHPAQPSTVESFDAIALLDESIDTLRRVKWAFVHDKATKRKREALRRDLAGVVADVQKIALALK